MKNQESSRTTVKLPTQWSPKPKKLPRMLNYKPVALDDEVSLKKTTTHFLQGNCSANSTKIIH